MVKDIGHIIASYRHCLTQIHNDEPWTQEDLAVAIGTDKAHINRIERGRQLPARATLIRICRALELPWHPEHDLLMAAGYASDPRLPCGTELDETMSRASKLIDDLPYPANLLDVIGRIWHWNPLALAFYASAIGVSKGALLAECHGRSVLELYFTHKRSSAFRSLFPDEYTRWIMIRVRRLARDWEETPEYQSLTGRLMQSPGFCEKWRGSAVEEPKVDYIERVITTLQHLQFGTLCVDTWWAPLHEDSRFVISHQMPANEGTRRAFALLACERRHPASREPVRPPRLTGQAIDEPTAGGIQLA